MKNIYNGVFRTMEIRIAGTRIMNTWLYPTGSGWVMIDTGYQNSYSSVMKKLRKMSIRTEEIQYIFLTHAHDDHAGFLNEWMDKHPHTQIIAHERAIHGLRKGQNRFEGGCSTMQAVLFCQLMALLGNGDHRYPKLSEEHLAKIITLNEGNLTQVESALHGKILFTPGHTDDSISLLVDGNLFCGDAAMDGIPSSYKITIWVENKTDYESSWETILASGAKKIYPAHGSPFCHCELRKNMKFIAGLNLRPLKYK